jgi:hypothetical protein
MESKWVAVKKRLPKLMPDLTPGEFMPFSHDLLLCHAKRREVYLGMYVKDPVTGLQYWQSSSGKIMRKKEITHWMELPEPPKEEE